MFGTDQPVPRFVQAFGRAKQLATEVFEPSKRVFGVVATWSELHASSQSRLAALRDAGFTAEPAHEWQAPLWPDEPEEDQIPARWMTFDLTDNVAARDVLVWCSVASEMRVRPRAAVISYLADFVRGIILYVYDDRGMDIISFESAPLLELYVARNNWLLDYDRPRMRRAFE